MLVLCENPTREADTLPITHSNLERKLPRGGSGGGDVKKRAGFSAGPLWAVSMRDCVAD